MSRSSPCKENNLAAQVNAAEEQGSKAGKENAEGNNCPLNEGSSLRISALTKLWQFSFTSALE